MSEKEVFKKLARILSKFTDVKKGKIAPATDLKRDLGLSSFDFVTIAIEIEEAFLISLENFDEFNEIETVGDIAEIVSRHKNKKMN